MFKMRHITRYCLATATDFYTIFIGKHILLNSNRHLEEKKTDSIHKPFREVTVLLFLHVELSFLLDGTCRYDQHKQLALKRLMKWALPSLDNLDPNKDLIQMTNSALVMSAL